MNNNTIKYIIMFINAHKILIWINLKSVFNGVFREKSAFKKNYNTFNNNKTIYY